MINKALVRFLQDVTWMSPDLDNYIAESLACVHETHELLMDIKRVDLRIKNLMEAWQLNAINAHKDCKLCIFSELKHYVYDTISVFERKLAGQGEQRV